MIQYYKNLPSKHQYKHSQMPSTADLAAREKNWRADQLK